MASQSLSGFMENEAQPYGERYWAYQRFGGATKASLRMFDATFSFSWVEDSRRMVEKVSGLFCIFWILWTVSINFTVMRVISAIFLKQTLVISAEDHERMQLQRLASKENYAQKIREILENADTSGDGYISSDEFMAFIYSPEVADAFIKLDLELLEVVALFRLLSDDSGTVDYEEFVQGALKLKQTASTLDAIQILHASKMLEDQIEGLAELIVGGYEPPKDMAE